MFRLNEFISKYVTHRENSMFSEDFNDNRTVLKERIQGRSVLVIGGAGSIGSAFIRELLPFLPGKLVVADINENALAELTRDLRSAKDIPVPEEYVTYPMDYASDVFERMVRANQGFDIVCNFSAHKHVRSEKDIFSVEALLTNNVLHAGKLLSLLSEFPPEHYFCVSTDKAANPVNVMGASKRIMEDLIFSCSDRFSVETARFANVAFSNGSLPAGFMERIARLQPISAPNDVKRYFVSPEESGQICLLACILGKNREIFFPKLKEEQMTSFDRIAVDLLREHGFDPLYCRTEAEALLRAEELRGGSRAYPVFFSKSDTSGEKAFEEFYTSDETTDMDRMKGLGVIIGKEIPDRDRLRVLLERLEQEFQSESAAKENVIEILKWYLPDFSHMEKGKSLDAKM